MNVRIGLCAAILCVSACSRKTAPPAAAPADIDLAQFGQTQEARAFLADSRIVIATEEIPVAALKQLPLDLYAAGAKQVLFAEIVSDGLRRHSARMVCILPEDPAARAKVLKTWTAVSSRLDGETEDDVGQKFVSLPFD